MTYREMLGPGYYLVRRRDIIVGLLLVIAGEHKGEDRFQGQPTDDTGIMALFLGPRMIAGVGRVSAGVGLEFPVSMEQYGVFKWCRSTGFGASDSVLGVEREGRIGWWHKTGIRGVASRNFHQSDVKIFEHLSS